MLVLAEHIVGKITVMCRTLILLKRPYARIHISNTDVSTCNGIATYEETIQWEQVVEEVLSAKGKRLSGLTHSTTADLVSSMTGILETQYRELVAGLMVVMMHEDITDYHIKMESGKITIDLKLLSAACNTVLDNDALRLVDSYISTRSGFTCDYTVDAHGDNSMLKQFKHYHITSIFIHFYYPDGYEEHYGGHVAFSTPGLDSMWSQGAWF